MGPLAKLEKPMRSPSSRSSSAISSVSARAIVAAMLHRVDDGGLLKHGDAETWMDAVGSDGPWSPRGDRAVEIQVLWLEQIRISVKWARYLGFTDTIMDGFEYFLSCGIPGKLEGERYKKSPELVKKYLESMPPRPAPAPAGPAPASIRPTLSVFPPRRARRA